MQHKCVSGFHRSHKRLPHQQHAHTHSAPTARIHTLGTNSTLAHTRHQKRAQTHSAPKARSQTLCTNSTFTHSAPTARSHTFGCILVWCPHPRGLLCLGCLRHHHHPVPRLVSVDGPPKGQWRGWTHSWKIGVFLLIVCNPAKTAVRLCVCW